jgi:uncharacterized membrane protein
MSGRGTGEVFRTGGRGARPLLAAECGCTRRLPDSNRVAVVLWLNEPGADMSALLDVSVTMPMAAPRDQIRAVMFEPRHDPEWMAAVKAVEPLSDSSSPGARVRRVGRFLGRTLKWTTEVIAVHPGELSLRIVDGPMRGTVTYRIEPSGTGSLVTIHNTGDAPGFAPRWLLAIAMRRSLTADLRRLRQAVEGSA